MKKVILIILAISFYPFGCEAQVNGTIGGQDGCDTVYIENPAWDDQVREFETMIRGLTEQNDILMAENKAMEVNILNLTTNVQNLTSENTSLKNDITTKNNEIDVLKSTVNELELALAEKPDTVYQDKIVEVMPKPTVDTVFVSHSNDDKDMRKFFHHGSFDAPFPKDITFETKEFCMITVEFPDSLGTLRRLDQFKLRRIQDHENARTMYEFIE